MFSRLGAKHYMAQCTRYLGIVRHKQRELVEAEQFLREVETVSGTEETASVLRNVRSSLEPCESPKDA